MGNTGEPILVKSVRPKPPFGLGDAPDDNELIGKVREIISHLESVARYEDSRAALLNSNFIIEGAQVESLSVEQLTGGIINTTDINIGSDKFILSSVNRRLTIKDDNNTTRVDIGRFGSGVAYGIKAYNSSGGVLMDLDGFGTDVIGSLQIVNGAVGTNELGTGAVTQGKIGNSQIVNSHIVDSTLQGVKLQDATIGSVKIADVSATKITGQVVNAQIANLDLVKVFGTLTADGNPAINITSAGALLLSNGGDILCRSSATDYSVIRFQSSAAASVGEIRITGSASSPTGIGITGTNGKIIAFSTSSADIFFNASAGLVRFNTPIAGLGSGNIQTATGIQPNINNVYNCGTSTRKWANVWTVVNNVGDIKFDNDWTLTELDHIYPEKDGLAFLDSEGAIMMIIEGSTIYAENIKTLKEFRYV